MKNKILIFILILTSFFLHGQTASNVIKGTVTYKTNKNVYVKFYSTDSLMIGDTLGYKTNNAFVPALIIKHKSSTSCVTENFSTHDFAVGETVGLAFFTVLPDVIETAATPLIKAPVTNSAEAIDTSGGHSGSKLNRKEILNGRLSISTNGNVATDNTPNFQRIRLALSMNIQNISASAFSVQSYITYRYRYGIDQSKVGFYDDFKIYALGVQFAPTEKYSLWIGRKINNMIANMGAIDGVQGELNLKKFTLGAFAGSRPDITNYTFAPNLVQYGGYIARNDKTGNGTAQTSLAIAEQQNNFKTDRRFMYFQHNNSLVKDLNLFLSAEMDMFKKIGDVVSNDIRLTSFYFSLRYKLRKNLSVSSSYDNRRNVIYYESYQTYIDQVIAQETRQGFRFQVNYSPLNLININVSNFYRYQGDNPKPTKNLIANITVSNIPGLNISTTLTANTMESYYFKGNILGARMSKNIFNGKVQTEINFRQLNYTFFNSETQLKQNIAGINFSINLMKLTSLILSYEGTFEPTKQYHRYFITAIQRFKN